MSIENQIANLRWELSAIEADYEVYALFCKNPSEASLKNYNLAKKMMLVFNKLANKMLETCQINSSVKLKVSSDLNNFLEGLKLNEKQKLQYAVSQIVKLAHEYQVKPENAKSTDTKEKASKVKTVVRKKDGFASFFEKIKNRFSKSFKRQQVKGEKKGNFFMAIPVVGALFVSGIIGGAALISNKTGESKAEKEHQTEENLELDTYDYGNFFNEKYTEDTETEEKSEDFLTGFATEPSTEYVEAESQIIEKETLSFEELHTMELQAKREKQDFQMVEGTTEGSSGDKENHTEQRLVVGSKVHLKNGVEYAENNSGNVKRYKIGEVSWRPEGDYVIDKIAYFYEGKMIGYFDKQGTDVEIEKKACSDKLKIEGNKVLTRAHVSIDNKVGPTGWLRMDLEDLKDNMVSIKNNSQGRLGDYKKNEEKYEIER